MPSYYVAIDRFGNYDLSHHGIKGQKWGVRRYQNADGTLTAAGKSRYGVNDNGSVSINTKSINKMSSDIAKSKVAAARNRANADKALQKGKFEKEKGYLQAAKEMDKAVASGKKELNRILSQYEKQGYKVSYTSTKEYANKGKVVAATIIAGIPAGLVVGAVDAGRYHKYGPEAMGFVDVEKYRLGRK